MQSLTAIGLDALALTSDLLHRIRLADPDIGIWEAADFQWWWRMPRRSDTFEQRFLVDSEGPLAAAIVTEWTHAWGLDPLVVPGAPPTLQRNVFVDTLARLGDFRRTAGGPDSVETMVRDDDADTLELVREVGFEPTADHGGNTSMAADDRPELSPLAPELTLVDRTGSNLGPHPMIGRNGPVVEERLRQLSLYDPRLDLAITTAEGETAAYALFWFDPATRVGLVEPMRVEDAWQRRGLGRALLTRGIARLADRGATRINVGWASPPGRNLYLSSGFVETATTTTYARSLG